MSGLVTVSRSYMQTLKAKKDEEKRIKDEEQRLIRIKQIVQNIYEQALKTAGQTTSNSFEYRIPNTGMSSSSCPFHAANMKEIIGELESLFADCSVKHTQMGQGRDGKLYDISSVDEKLRPLIIVNRYVECIVVDWS